MTDIEVEVVGTEGAELKAPKAIAWAKNAQDFGINIEIVEGVFNPNEVKFLVYGESGCGKTVLASTFPAAIFIDIDHGMASIRNRVARIDVNTVDAVEGWDQVTQTIDYLATTSHPFKTLVIDSINELQELAKRAIVLKYPSIRRAYENLPSQSDYGKLLDDYDKAVRKAKALSMNVVYIGNVAPQEFETDMVQPQLIGKHSAKTMTRMVDVVGYLYRMETGDQKKGRNIVFDASNYVTKDRSGVLPPAIADPSYTQMYEYWKLRLPENLKGE
ncbi:MAG TPA: ATP-binding protein [Thermodesulfobacteriota bacterium]|nr:ATP-binding protein [Thermodesulfobacteriota bacterium]